jgi:hypothetical protein
LPNYCPKRIPQKVPRERLFSNSKTPAREKSGVIELLRSVASHEYKDQTCKRRNTDWFQMYDSVLIKHFIASNCTFSWNIKHIGYRETHFFF